MPLERAYESDLTDLLSICEHFSALSYFSFFDIILDNSYVLLL